ncbi:hypothetical protein BD31_I2002, partial [Candidatus Nitrosopumilus salaria BD31]
MKLPSPWLPLLKYSKTIRDPVHGDVKITKFESIIMDTEPFQKLRHIRQLGLTYLVYPGAQHSRFEHSIGAIHVAQQIMNAIDENFENRDIISKNFSDKITKNENYFQSLSSRDKVLARCVALLHDAAHLPFGHTLEKEGNILQSTQWADKRRLEYFFQECGMEEKIFSFLIEYVDKSDANDFIAELKLILQAIEGIDPKTHKPNTGELPEDSSVSNLEHPYIGDIVGNTICADLVDYILRDSYFTGLKFSRELRLLSNFALTGKTKNDSRVTLLLVRKGRVRPADISEAVEFVRERYYLAERVYYHRVKAAASAMLINAVYAYLKFLNGGFAANYETLMDMGDDALLFTLSSLCKSKTEPTEPKYERAVVKKLISDLQSRQLYKPVFMVHGREDGKEKNEIQDLIETFVDPEKRFQFQKYLEELLDLKPGTVILYITRKDKGKIARTRCLWTDGKVKPLNKIAEQIDNIEKELNVIRKKHSELWRLYVFLDRDSIETKGHLVASYC